LQRILLEFAPPLRRAATCLVAVGIALMVSACSPAGSNDPLTVPIAFPGGPGSAQARLGSDMHGMPLLSWIEPEGDFDVLRFARLGPDGFGGVQDVVRSERMFVNWADFPSVTPITDTLWFAHWLRLQPESRGSYDIATAISTDGGQTWIAAEQMNDDEVEAEHGFVSVFGWNEQIAAFWLDGRELANWSFDEPEALLGTSLRFARYADDGTVLQREIIDELVCDCCQPDVAMSEAGPILAYRDRTEDEIRDVVVRRFVDGRWTDPVSVGAEGWYIEGCPVNGPAVTARGNRVAAAWFTAANGQSRVRFARSDDSGASFSDAVNVETRGAFGQTGIVLDTDGRAVVSWWRRSEQGGIDLMVRSYDRNNLAGEPVLIGHEAVGQPIDVPQMIAVGNAYLIAWTSFDGDGTVRLVRLELPH
jgi:hypothetical protein